MSGKREFFQYVVNLGGYTGAVTDPTEIQWELYRHGPMTVSVMVDNKYFRKLDPYGFNNSINNTESDDPKRHYFYDEVNHLVLLVGWIYNESTNETYWII